MESTGAHQPPVINIIGAESSEPEQADALPFSTDADDYSFHSSPSSSYGRLSPQITDSRLPDEEGPIEDVCIVRCYASPASPALPTLTASRGTSSPMAMANRYAISARIPRFAFTVRTLMLQSQPPIHPSRWYLMGFFNLTSTNSVK